MQFFQNQMIGRKSSLLDVVAQLSSSLVGRACYLMLQILLARLLGPRAFGLYAIGWTIVSLAGALAPLGMPQAVIRYEIASRSVLQSAPLLLATIAGCLCSAGLAFWAGPLASIVFREPGAALTIQALAPSVPLLGACYIFCATLRASGHNINSAVVNALVFVFYLGITIILFQWPAARSSATAGWSYDAAVGLSTLLAWIMCRNIQDRRPSPKLRPLLAFGFLTMIIHTVSILNLQVDRLIIGIVTDAKQVGLYQVASQLAMIALVFRVAALSVFEARVPKRCPSTQQSADITCEFVASTRILLHFSAPGLICLALSSAGWTTLLFGSEYASAATPLAILVMGQLLQSFAGPALTALHMTGNERAAMTITLVAFVMNALGNFLLVPLAGLSGSALATSAAAFATGAASLLRLHQAGRIRGNIYASLDILAAVGISAIPPFVAFSLGLASFFVLISVAVFSYLLYGLVVYRFRKTEDELFEMIEMIIHKASSALHARLSERWSRGI